MTLRGNGCCRFFKQMPFKGNRFAGANPSLKPFQTRAFDTSLLLREETEPD